MTSLPEHQGMSNYISPFYVIATSGTTRDGRVIQPEWLLSAASTYDPEEAEALLWYDHSRWYNPGGAVVDCKTEKLDDGRVQLLARIKPTPSLMYEAEHAEVPFLFSIELRRLENGDYYLDGLAYTHDPASKAVDKMEFSQHRPDVVLGGTESIEKLEFKAKGLLSKLFNRQPPTTYSHSNSKRSGINPDPEDINEMTPEQFALLQQVNAKLDTFNTQLAEIKQNQGDYSTVKEGFDSLKQEFSKLAAAQKETHVIVEEIGNTSQGRFKRKPATGGAGGVSFKDFGLGE